MGIQGEIEFHRRDPNPHPNLRPVITDAQISTIVGQVLGQLPPIPSAGTASPLPVTLGVPSVPGSSDLFSPQDHRHALSLPSALVQLAGATAAGIAMCLAVNADAQEALLGIPYLRTSGLTQYMTLEAILTAPRAYTFPDQDGTVALLEREQTFTMRQSVLSDVTQEANASWTLPADRTEIGHGVVATGGYFYSRSGLEVITQGIYSHNFGLLCEFDPSTNKGSMVAWRDQRDGLVIGHVGVDVGASRRFSMLTEPDTTLDQNIYMLPAAAEACRFTELAPSDATKNCSIGGGSVVVKTELGVGSAPAGSVYADFQNTNSKWMRIRGFSPFSAAFNASCGLNSTIIGGGSVETANQVIVGSVSAPNDYTILRYNRLEAWSSSANLHLRLNASECELYSSVNWLIQGLETTVRTGLSDCIFKSAFGALPTTKQVHIANGGIWTASDITAGITGSAQVNAQSLRGNSGSGVGTGCRLDLSADIAFRDSALTLKGWWDHTTDTWRFGGSVAAAAVTDNTVMGGGVIRNYSNFFNGGAVEISGGALTGFGLSMCYDTNGGHIQTYNLKPLLLNELGNEVRIGGTLPTSASGSIAMGAGRIITTGDLWPRSVQYVWPSAAAAGVLTCDVSGNLSWAAGGGGGVSGSGTTGKIPKWSGSTALTDSIISESASVLSIGGSTASAPSANTVTAGGGWMKASNGCEVIRADGTYVKIQDGQISLYDAFYGGTDVKILAYDSSMLFRVGAGIDAVFISSGGTVQLVNTLYCSSGIQMDGEQVVSNRQYGWTAATGTATRTSFDTSTVTTAQLAERVKAAIDDLIAHGLIGA